MLYYTTKYNCPVSKERGIDVFVLCPGASSEGLGSNACLLHTAPESNLSPCYGKELMDG